MTDNLMRPLRFSRRRLLQSALLGGASLAALGVGTPSLSTTGEFEKSFHRIPIPNLPSDLQGFRIGFISDVHLSLFYPNEWLEQALQSLYGEIDLLMLGGDFLWIPDRAYQWKPWPPRNQRFVKLSDPDLPALIYKDLAQAISSVAPHHGAIGCLGNHDRWSRSAVCISQLAAQQIQVAVNEWVTVRRGSAALHIWATDDYWNGLPKLPLQPRNPAILLTHNPDLVRDYSEQIATNFDLVLAGHTHGGQIKLPLLGAMTYGIRHRPFGEGLIRLSDRCSLFVSRGLGMVEIPFRINCPGETSVLELHAP
ncbi:MAG: metallophosphoesterase [Bdellovibrionota bacterium]|nr:MAG: metallophosphoesterase [Bdellovibrionota bacterium]